MKTQTIINSYVREAFREIARCSPSVTVVKRGTAFETTTVTLDSGYGPVTIDLVPNTAFTDSFYRVQRPDLGCWQGRLNGMGRRGDYGHTPGKAKER